MKIQGQHRHQEYMAFRDIAEALGFGRVRQADLRTRVTIDTDGAQEAAANTEWQIAYFGDSNSLPLALRTQEPKLTAGQALPNEYLMCFPSMSLVYDQHATGQSDIEQEEVLGKLGLSAIEVKSGTDILIQKVAGLFLTGTPGVNARQGALASAAAPTVRADIAPMREGGDLDDPLLWLPGGSLEARLVGQGAWTTTDDIVLDLMLHGWIATAGKGAELAKVIGLADALAELKQRPAQLKLRAKV